MLGLNGLDHFVQIEVCNDRVVDFDQKLRSISFPGHVALGAA
jgi:hypothetical protein